MTDKLQELTSRIYKEGISKGKEEAKRIREAAEQEAKEIIEKAKAEAERIVSEAESKAKEHNETMSTELRLSSLQAINALKQEISEMIQSEVIRKSTENAFTDQSFMNEVIITMARNWNPDENSMDLTAILPASKEREVLEYFNSKAKDLLDKGLTLKFNDNMQKGFEIGPKNGSYTIGFTGSDFEAFIKEFLRPRMISLLFGEGKEKEDSG
jgi:V/A-type H+-transporting ATPase subunit E